MKIIILIFLAALLMGCSTDDSIIESYPNNEHSETIEYVQGEIGFGLKDSVTLMELANYIYSLDKCLEF